MLQGTLARGLALPLTSWLIIVTSVNILKCPSQTLRQIKPLRRNSQSVWNQDIVFSRDLQLIISCIWIREPSPTGCQSNGGDLIETWHWSCNFERLQLRQLIAMTLTRWPQYIALGQLATMKVRSWNYLRNLLGETIIILQELSIPNLEMEGYYSYINSIDLAQIRRSKRTKAQLKSSSVLY